MRASALLVAGVAILALRTSPPRAEQSTVELRVTIPPARVAIDGSDYGVYELHIRNTSSHPVQVTRLDVLPGAEGRPLQSFAGDDLTRRLARFGASGSTPSADVMPAGARGVIYIELRLPADESVVDLRHRLTYAPVAQPTATRHVDGAMFRVGVAAPPVLGPPLRGGPWAAVHSPAWERGHRRVFYTIDGRERIPGRFAIDWIRLDAEGRSSRGDPDAVASALGYGADVLAVADAVVAATRDDVDEVPRVSARRKHAPEDASGNYVALDLDGGRYVFYEHLKPGSVRVRPGQRVRRGEVVAALGFTGDSTGPHLHLHVADAPSPLGAEGVPFVLDRFDVIGQYRDIADLGQRPWTPARPTPSRRERERPASNVVVEFGSVK
jgi:hypothetical protein